MARYTIFGAGPGGLYTAWRLATSGKLGTDDSIELVEWGEYAFENDDGGTRLPAGRICSHHYQNDVKNSYIEVGGMRFLEYDETTHTGHQLVTETIKRLGMWDDVVPFLTTDNPLFYLRNVHFYQDQIESGAVTAPYNTPYNSKTGTDVYTDVSNALTAGNNVETRTEQCAFYAAGTLSENTSGNVFKSGDVTGNIGYWNYFYTQVLNEGTNYALDAGGYSSNLINWNAANAAVYNGEFAPGGAFKTLKTGYSQLFVQLFRQTQAAANQAGITFTLTQSTRLHSIWTENGIPHYRVAQAAEPFAPIGDTQTTDYAFLAMPKHSVELVAQATRYSPAEGDASHFLNALTVQNYLESVIEQPSYKIAMFFHVPWWQSAPYAPKLISSQGDNASVFGPTITDLPLRQVYYFGNNAPDATGEEVYGLLASYDDMRFVRFWQELELGPNERRTVPISQDYQPLEGARTAPDAMVNMLLLELARLHYGDVSAAEQIPAPLETVAMDWGYNPFGAGYHAWGAHYNINDVMQTIRKPTTLAGGDGNVFIVGSAYSNDQAWVEGAFCTAESVLTDFLDIPTIADTTGYPLICGGPSCGA